MARKDDFHRHHGRDDMGSPDGDPGTDNAQASMDPGQFNTGTDSNAGLTGISGGSFSSQPNGTSLSPTADGLSMVEFITGLNSSGKLDTTDPNYWNWAGNTPATYNASGFAHEWTPGSTVNYWFNPASSWTVVEKAAFTDALNIWSAVANIHFSLSSSSSGAIDITRGGGGVASTNATFGFNAPLGMGLITSAAVSIGTSGGALWSSLGSFSVHGGYGPETVLHELGHALGLGHAGPYNATVSSSQPIYTADTRQYSIMSYVDPGSTIATTVDSKNGATPSSANYTNASGTFVQTTPGQYDILAIQRLYGASTSGPLTIGETFGFNASSVLTTNMPTFDFTVNTNPVVTIYDSGTGNTLDLSGFSVASTVDLNPGQFSSADGMVDNIGIAFNTWVDTAIGGSGNDTFYVNAQADTINGGGGSNNAVVFGGNEASYTLAQNAGTVTVSSLGITDTLSNIQTLQFADASLATGSIPCFAQGTRILTPSGEVAVEQLAEGDLLCTASGGVRPVKWLGYRTINLAAHPHPPAAAPVRIKREAFGDGLPRRDLLLSPDHAVLVDGSLIPAVLLVNGCTIVQELDTVRITYLHVELDRHDIVLAEGLAVESYLDTGNRAMFANAGLALILHPDCSVRTGLKSWVRDACAPLLTEGAPLHAARLRLLQRATDQGVHMADDPRLRLVTAGREVLPLTADNGRYVFVLPGGSRSIHIRSRSAVPVETRAHDDDHRQLGVAVTRMVLADGYERRELPVDHPCLSHGWHGVERDDGRIWRWTDGAALMLLGAPVRAGTICEIHISGRLTYPQAASVPLVCAAA